MSKHSVTKRLFALALWLGVALGMASCGTPPVAVLNPNLEGTLYLRHNLHAQQAGAFKESYISNYLDFTDILPYGSEVEIRFYSAQVMELMVDGKPTKVRPREFQFPVDGPGIARFIQKHFTRNKDELEALQINPASVTTIEKGVPAIGMTKEEVLLSLGYPMQIDSSMPAHDLDRDRILASGQWIYLQSLVFFWFRGLVILQFDSDGKLMQVLR